jgi:cell volume regulation protein A
MLTIEYTLVVGAILILVSIAIARMSDNLGVPTLLLFLGVGMLAGSEGPGGIYFDDAGLAQSIGIIALLVILFAGGLDTSWREVKPVVRQASILATIGVFVTAVAVGLFATAVLGMPPLSGMLLGAIVSSTDAAAVFSVLRSRNVSLAGRLKPLLELESGSNDPMAVFLTVGVIELIRSPGTSPVSLLLLFVSQMGIGAAFGLGLGRAMVFIINRLKLAYEGIYSVFVLAFAALIFSGTAVAGGSGFLAVYVAGLVAGNSDFIQKKSILRFFDGLAWLSQIAMFLTMGLLVFPSRIVEVIGPGLLASAFLMFIARPVSVFLSLAGSGFGWREKVLVSWVGLRGAVPIILAVFPMIAGIADAGSLFNVVFFIVLTSALFQGWSIAPLAKLLRLDAPLKLRKRSPLEFAAAEGADTELVDLIVPYNSAIAGRSIIELGMPRDSLIVLISRNDSFLVPSGGTVLQESDTVLVLVNKDNLPAVREIFSKQLPAAP